MTYLTVNEAAAQMRCHEKTILRMVKRGDLAATYFGGKYLIDEAALARPVPQRLAAPRPRRRTGRFAAMAESMNRSATS